MAKFPTEVESTITINAPAETVYAYLWDVVGSSVCIPGLASCKRVAEDTYRFVFQEVSTAGMRMTVQYTAHYQGDGRGSIRFKSAGAADDNTEIDGALGLRSSGAGTKITLRQMVAPDTPVPTLLQRLVKSFAEREARNAVEGYLANLKRALDSGAAAKPGKRKKT
jgi:carbon monoxide dehydrogenase subunit G